MNFKDFIRIQALLNRCVIHGAVEMDDFVRIGWKGHDFAQFMPCCSGNTGFFPQFPSGASQGRFPRFPGSGRDFPYRVLDGITVLANQQDIALGRYGHNRSRSGVADDIQGRLDPIGQPDPVTIQGKDTSGVDDVGFLAAG